MSVLYLIAMIVVGLIVLLLIAAAILPKHYSVFPVNLPSYLIGRGFIKKAQQQTLSNIKAIVEQTTK